MSNLKTSKPTHPVIADAHRAAQVLSKASNQSPLPNSVAKYLQAVAKHWELGWLPASPTEIDRATVAIIQAVLSTYQTPEADAGTRQQVPNQQLQKG
jgi:hypothetical protein